MFIEAVTVCVNYPDFLAAVIDHNLSELDHWVIVTDHKDTATQALVASHNAQGRITLVVTDVFYEAGATFNKGAGVALGLTYCLGVGNNAWVLHLDGDIYLPDGFYNFVNQRLLDPNVLYGMDRVNCVGYEKWKAYQANPQQVNTADCLVRADVFPLMNRVAHFRTGEGYLPAGFFQLWNPSVSGVHTYPTDSDGADRTDIQFSHQFSCLNRQLLPDSLCIHLESEACREGSNWWGRRTPPFLPAGEQLSFNNSLPQADLGHLLEQSSTLAALDGKV